MPEVKDLRSQMLEYLSSWGVGLILMGIAHFVLSSLLWAEWGVVLIVLGVLCFVVKHRAMFIPIGSSLMLIGILNAVGGLNSGVGFWTIFGGLQVYWGIKELAKFGEYKGVAGTGQVQIEEGQTLDSEAA